MRNAWGRWTSADAAGTWSTAPYRPATKPPPAASPPGRIATTIVCAAGAAPPEASAIETRSSARCAGTDWGSVAANSTDRDSPGWRAPTVKVVAGNWVTAAGVPARVTETALARASLSNELGRKDHGGVGYEFVEARVGAPLLGWFDQQSFLS